MTLVELFRLLRRRLKLLICLPLLCAIFMGAYAYLMLPNSYTSSASMYVLVAEPASGSTGGGAVLGSDLSSLQGNLNSSQMITNDITDLINSSRVREQVAADLNLRNLDGYSIAVASETNSRVITLTVTGEDPTLTARVANSLVENVSGVAQEVMGVTSVNAVDEAEVPETPSGPKRPLYVIVAAMGGLMFAVALVVVSDMFNTRVRDKDTLEALTDLPVMGRIPVVSEVGDLRG